MAPTPWTARLFDWVNRFGPPIALMAVVYALSAQPDLNSGLGTADLIGRKLVHMAEFGVLFLLWLRATRWRSPVLATVLALAWAAADEIHQTTVPGRHGAPLDVVIDMTGIAIAWVWWARRRSRRTGADDPSVV